MSAAVFTVRRRDLAWATALVVLVSTVWTARGDIADAGGSPPGEGIAVVYIAVGTNFPDALGVGPGAGLNGAPIILVPTTGTLDPDTSAELIRLDPRQVIIIGGTSAVSDAMEDTLVALLPNATFSRVAGTNRYKTNAAFSAATFPIEAWASIPAAAFTGASPASDTSVFIDTSALGSYLVAPIQLPHGASILELKIRAVDTNAGADLTVALERVTSEVSVTTVASVATTGSGGDQTQSTTVIAADGSIVNNKFFGWRVVVLGGTGRAIVNVMVRYQLGQPTS